MLPNLDRQYRDAPTVLAAPGTVLGRCFFLLWFAFLGICGRQCSTNQTAPVKKSPVASSLSWGQLGTLTVNYPCLCGVPRRSFTANLHQFDASSMSWSPGFFPRDQQGYGVPVAVPLGLPHTRTTRGSAAHQPGTGNTGFRYPPAEPHIRLNVR